MNVLNVFLGTTVAIVAMTSATYANPVSINTDRVQVRVGENGAVEIRTSTNRPTVLDSTSVRPEVWPTTRVTPLPFANCYPSSHTVHNRTTSSASSGDRVYTQSRISTRLCQ